MEGERTAELFAASSYGLSHQLYPIGVLFGLGFDTASEVGLLGVAALAQSQAGDNVPASYIIVLPVLFTCGMALVDSVR